MTAMNAAYPVIPVLTSVRYLNAKLVFLENMTIPKDET